MVKSIGMTLMLVGLLPYTVALADGDDPNDPNYESSLRTIDTARTSMQLQLPGDRKSFTALDTLEFQDSSAVGRAQKIRSLSLLTLAEFRKSRVYLGVNRRGLLGLHFNAGKHSTDRHLEIARMPYLPKHNAE